MKFRSEWKMPNSFFFSKTSVLLTQQVNIFWVQPKNKKNVESKVLQVGQSQFFNTGLWIAKKVKNERLKSRFGRKNDKLTFSKNACLRHSISYISGMTKKCTKGRFVNLSEWDLKKQGSEVRKKRKTSIWYLKLGKKRQIQFSKKGCSRSRGYFFSGLNQKMR